MIGFTVALAALVAAAAALPRGILPPNVVTVPPNCPPGQEYWNGQCREVWFLRSAAVPQNAITVPPNCLPGQVFVNGQCRDVWYTADAAVPANAITVPPNCPPGQQWVNGACREIWRSMLPQNVVVVPPNCPDGQVLVNGQCRDLWFTAEQLKLWSSLVDNFKTVEEMFAQLAAAEGGANKKRTHF